MRLFFETAYTKHSVRPDYRSWILQLAISAASSSSASADPPAPSSSSSTLPSSSPLSSPVRDLVVCLPVVSSSPSATVAEPLQDDALVIVDANAVPVCAPESSPLESTHESTVVIDDSGAPLTTVSVPNQTVPSHHQRTNTTRRLTPIFEQSRLPMQSPMPVLHSSSDRL